MTTVINTIAIDNSTCERIKKVYFENKEYKEYIICRKHEGTNGSSDYYERVFILEERFSKDQDLIKYISQKNESTGQIDALYIHRKTIGEWSEEARTSLYTFLNEKEIDIRIFSAGGIDKKYLKWPEATEGDREILFKRLDANEVKKEREWSTECGNIPKTDELLIEKRRSLRYEYITNCEIELIRGCISLLPVWLKEESINNKLTERREQLQQCRRALEFYIVRGGDKKCMESLKALGKVFDGFNNDEFRDKYQNFCDAVSKIQSNEDNA